MNVLNKINNNKVEVSIPGRNEPFTIETDDCTAWDIAVDMFGLTVEEPTVELDLNEVA